MIKKILISQPAPAQKGRNPYTSLQEGLHLDLVFHPFIKVEPVTEREFRDQKVDISAHTAVVFSSRHAIDNFFHLCKEMRVKISDDMKYYGVSEQVVLYIQKYVQYRKRKVFFSPTGRWEDLLPSMLKHKTERFLIPENSEHTDVIATLMSEKGLNFTECVMYRTVPNVFTDGTRLSDFDAVVLFTASGVKSLVSNFPDWEQGDTKLICFGDSTCKAVEGTTLRLDYNPEKSRVVSISKALETYIRECNESES